jgi:methylmalonyl-CoA mutase
MIKKLFSEFNPSNKTTWKEQVEKETKKPVAELNRDVIENTESLDPYYSFEEFDPSSVSELVRAQRKTPGWLNTPDIHINNTKVGNQKLQTAISGGAQALILHLLNNIETDDVSWLLHNIKLTETPVFFKTQQDPLQVFDLVSRDSGYSIKGGIAYDPLAQTMCTSNSPDINYKNLANLCIKSQTMTDFYPLMVEGHAFHNAGATPEQELAFMMGSMALYLDKLTDLDVPAPVALQSIFFSVSIGTNYLAEIAKLRALRMLHRRMVTAYGTNTPSAFIHASTSSLYISDTLPHTNMIRATSAAMSAVIGGCDALTVKPYDVSLNEDNYFSERIARNVSSIVAQESYINRVADPAAGSYYIEKLSQKIADSAWALFLEIEKKGGITVCFDNGFIMDQLETSWKYKSHGLLNGGVMVGVNKYLDSNQKQYHRNPKPDTTETEHRYLKDRNLAKFWYNHQQ